MAGNLPLQHTSASSSGPHSSGATLMNSDQTHEGVFAGVIPALLRGGYSVIQYITHPTPESTTPECIDLESQSINDQQVINTGRQPDTVPGPLPQAHDTSSTLKTTYADPDAGQPALTREDGSSDMPLHRPKLPWVWVAALIFIVLSLIMLPGLIVGIVTNQAAWGIATSGAVAPVVVFFGGLFYHHNK